MVETSFEVQVPKSLLQFGLNQAEVQRRVTEWLVLSLFTEERISSGKAAKLLNMSRIEFLALLRARGITFWSQGNFKFMSTRVVFSRK